MDFVFKMALILTMSGEIRVWVAECVLVDCKETTFWHTDVGGIGHKKNTKKKKKDDKIGIFQFVNNAYAWKLKSKSGMCLHHF